MKNKNELEKEPPIMDKTKSGVRMNEMRNKMRNARMNTHLYSFNGKILQQTSGGPIGLRATWPVQDW